MHASKFASASGDGTAKIWDTRTPASVVTIVAHANEVGKLSDLTYTYVSLFKYFNRTNFE